MPDAPGTNVASLLGTTTTSYLELIGNARVYRVPPFQRDYAWTESRVPALRAMVRPPPSSSR